MLYSYPAPRGALTVIVPVARAQVGWIVVVAVAAAGAVGCALITTLADGNEIHPVVLVTVKLYMPGVSSDIVVLVPVPVVVTVPG